MIRRHTFWSSVCFLVAASSTVAAQEASSQSNQYTYRSSSDQNRLNVSINLSPSGLLIDDWVDSVSMSRPPPGSLMIRYDGLHGFMMKQIRGQCRQFVRRSIKQGWMVRADDEDAPIYQSVVERDWVGFHTNGAWWTRSWMDSLTPERGGAPSTPFTHTYGREVTLRRGPIEVTNTLKVRFDYIGLFEVNPDPVEPQSQARTSPIALDVQPDGDLSVGSCVLFKVRPKLRIAVPRSADPGELVKSAAVQVSFEIVEWGKTIIKGEVQVNWRAPGETSVTFDMTLAAW